MGRFKKWLQASALVAALIIGTKLVIQWYGARQYEKGRVTGEIVKTAEKDQARVEEAAIQGDGAFLYKDILRRAGAEGGD